MTKSVSSASSVGAPSAQVSAPVDLAIEALPVALLGVIIIAAVLGLRARRVSRPRPVRSVEPSVTIAEPKGTKYCFDCGAQISARAEICPKCGVRQSAPPSGFAGTGAGRTRLVAALFAILLGGLGLHKFYLGQVGWGVVYLIFCWTFIPAIVGLIEGISLLVMSDQAFAVAYN